MKKIYWIILSVACIIFSFYNNYNKSFYTLNNYIIGSLFLALYIFLPIFFLLKLIFGITQKKIVLGVVYGILLIISIGWLFFETSPGFYNLLVIPKHFRTNIFTGNCEVLSFHDAEQPGAWRYKDGCNIPNEEKIKIIKSDADWFNRLKNSCDEWNKNCDNYQTAYCQRQPLEFEFTKSNLTCAELLETP